VKTYCTRLVEREDGFAHLALAGLDLLGDRDLFLASEERHAAHLLEVHADRIGGLAGARSATSSRSGASSAAHSASTPSRLLRQRRSLFRGGLDVDVDVAEHRDDLIDLLGAAGIATGDLAGLAVDRGARRWTSLASRRTCRLLLFGSFIVSFHATSFRSGRTGGGPLSSSQAGQP
jgi:hypothetical protein